MLSCSPYCTPALIPSVVGCYALFAIELESGAGIPQLRSTAFVWLFRCSGFLIPLPSSLIYEIRGVSCFIFFIVRFCDCILSSSLFNHSAESFGIAHGQIGQYFAIDGDICFLQAVDQAAVGGAILTGCRVYPADP